MPELLTCCHEESSVAMAHGYAKIEGKPMMIMAHGTVGLQHASMAIYNAYADRVPVYIVLGNVADGPFRRSDVEWAHSVQDAAPMVRDYTKWDDAPVSLRHFAESAVRAYKIMMTPPMGPVVIVADAVLQEEPMSEEDRRRLRVPKLSHNDAAGGRSVRRRRRREDAGRRRESGDRRGTLRAHSEWPEAAGRACRTAAGPGHRPPSRMNFPSRHPLYGPEISPPPTSSWGWKSRTSGM